MKSCPATFSKSDGTPVNTAVLAGVNRRGRGFSTAKKTVFDAPVLGVGLRTRICKIVAVSSSDAGSVALSEVAELTLAISVSTTLLSPVTRIRAPWIKFVPVSARLYDDAKRVAGASVCCNVIVAAGLLRVKVSVSDTPPPCPLKASFTTATR